ncbi:C45 family peptidase [Leucobacter allii]|uniref:C45 family autoproteolytic acyltransferase/hydolase n=1 Tax=Leucobacter allii TaxID=2932247 RepID=UPI001FD485F3|nr:C45 family peptidase [Leucobacter allii]UOR01456.1 C45 family peptidase [Leucobacter allii]
MTDSFPFHRFAGSHFEVGRQHGEALRPRILRHLERLERRFARQGFTLDDAEGAALAYRESIRAVSTGLDEEIHGLAEGAGIPLGAAFLLQLRAEVFVDLVGRHGAEQECTTFAILPERSGTARGFVGQNADLPAMYHDLMTVVRVAVADEPEVLMVTPAGQISYIGINDAGLGVFANYLHCASWRAGFPRYLYTRIALRERTVGDAEAALRRLHRASSRNIIMLDSRGGAVDLENTPETMLALAPEDGVLVHANHYVHGSLVANESNPWVENSRIRQRRLAARIEAADGPIGEEEIAAMLRDRSDVGNALSIHPEDDVRDVDPEDRNMTVTSVIAEPGRGQIWVASGPPSRSPYAHYAFSDTAATA